MALVTRIDTVSKFNPPLMSAISNCTVSQVGSYWEIRPTVASADQWIVEADFTISKPFIILDEFSTTEAWKVESPTGLQTAVRLEIISSGNTLYTNPPQALPNQGDALPALSLGNTSLNAGTYTLRLAFEFPTSTDPLADQVIKIPIGIFDRLRYKEATNLKERINSYNGYFNHLGDYVPKGRLRVMSAGPDNAPDPDQMTIGLMEIGEHNAQHLEQQGFQEFLTEIGADPTKDKATTMQWIGGLICMNRII